jgi:predicted dehydrogenase
LDTESRTTEPGGDVSASNDVLASTLGKVRWGVLGASHFAKMATIPAMQQSSLVSIEALASRSLDKARADAALLGIKKAFGSYEELIDDPDIEAIYNPLPNHLHVPWSIKAVRAGKHVLCEKPIAMNAQEAEQLLQAQQEAGVLVAEAFMVRHHPQWEKVVELVQADKIGPVRAVQTTFSYHNVDHANIRNQKEAGGGALYDIGCYAVNTARLVFGKEPVRVAAVCEQDPQSGCDRLTSGILDFGTGQATFIVATQQVPYQRVQIFGTRGHIEVEIPFNAPNSRPCRLLVDPGSLGSPDFTVAEDSRDRAETFVLPIANHYTLQGHAFSEAIRTGKTPQNSIADAVANARVLDAIFQAASSERWERV